MKIICDDGCQIEAGKPPTPSHPPSNLSTLLQAMQAPAVDLQFSTLLQAMQALLVPLAAVDLQRNTAYHIPLKWAINSGL